MTTGTGPAIDPAWALDTDQLSNVQRVARNEAVLNLRRTGKTLEHIAAVLGIRRHTASGILVGARRGGDPRALSDERAALVRAVLAKEALGISPAAEQARAQLAEGWAKALDLADFCEARAAQFATLPNVSAGLLHLADLLREFGPRRYPILQLKDGGELLSLAFLIPRDHTFSVAGSSAAACQDA